jgi:predicted CoA-binding protein
MVLMNTQILHNITIITMVAATAAPTANSSAILRPLRHQGYKLALLRACY